jgi:creatinine amidohydrolase
MTITSFQTAWDFQATPPEIAILPLACTEPHGPHLPIGADILIIEAIARVVAGRLPATVFLLPTWPLGFSIHHDGEPGTISLSYETLSAVVSDVAASLHQHGVHKFVVINDHGTAGTSTALPVGNSIVKTAVRQLNYANPGLVSIWVQPFAAGREKLDEIFPSARQEIHAGAVETSILMHLAPRSVGPIPPDEIPSAGPEYLSFTKFSRLSSSGVWGRPGEASAEKGKEALEAVVDATVIYIEDTFAKLSRMRK